MPIESKKQKSSGKILSLDTMNPPAWAKNHFTEADAISLLTALPGVMRYTISGQDARTTRVS
jgi:hypothetical protein